MTLTLLIIAALLLAAAIAMTFLPSRWSAPVAWAGMVLTILSGHIMLSTSQIVFWGIAAAIVLALNFLLPPDISRSRVGINYIAAGTIIGTLLGILASGPAMIVGSLIGAAAGAIAYSRTPRGRNLGFPSRPFFNYLAAKGLPAVITICIIGITLALLVSQQSLIQQ